MPSANNCSLIEHLVLGRDGASTLRSKLLLRRTGCAVRAAQSGAKPGSQWFRQKKRRKQRVIGSRAKQTVGFVSLVCSRHVGALLAIHRSLLEFASIELSRWLGIET